MGVFRKMVAARLKRLAIEKGRCAGLWRRIGRPGLHEWAEYLKMQGNFYAFGNDCAMSPHNHFSNPQYIRIGNNVRIAGAFLSGHDGSVNMINRAFGKKLDSVGRIDIGNNVFIGYGAIVLPNVRIGDNTIIASGAVVTRDIDGDCVAAGVPARKVSDLSDYVARLEARNATFPWKGMIEARASEYDAALEKELDGVRIAHFFGQAGSANPSEGNAGTPPDARVKEAQRYG